MDLVMKPGSFGFQGLQEVGGRCFGGTKARLHRIQMLVQLSQ